MKERQTREEKMSAIQQKLEDGVREIFSSEKYWEYISAMSKFPRYSINNCILIASQLPEASLVCGFRKWQTEFNRTVNKGEHGIMILAPIKGKTEVEEDVFDENNRAVVDENGNQKTEKVMREYQTFRPVYVFDVSQTSGDPVPTLATELDENVDSFEEMKEVLISISPVPISFEVINGGANGYYSPTAGKIVIDERLLQLQMLKTMIHEIAHATLGHGSKEDKWDRQTKEVQAESVAYWVTQMIGLDTSEYSFGYISGWSKDKEVSELKESLDVIKQTADKLSSSIEEKIRELRSEKEALPMVSEDKEPYVPAPHKKR
ncbi:MAG: hypothetical protein IJJ64_09660 [Butyrivibrio sp.]|nr:hypothetical protein [Butyrivibrio sp.]